MILNRFVLIFVFTLSSISARAAGLTCQNIPDLMKIFLLHHVSTRKLTDQVKKDTVENYIKMVDGSKVLMLKSDIESMRNEIPKIFVKMRGWKAPKNCEILEKFQRLAVQRAAENEKFVNNFLGEKYKFDENVEIVTDSDKRKYAKNRKDLEKFLEGLIHFQISNYLLADKKLPEAKKLLKKRYKLITKRFREMDVEKIYGRFVQAFAASLDPHTAYFTKVEWEEFQIDMSRSLEGIGASLSSQDGFTTVEAIIKGGAADKAKDLKRKDRIVAVGQGKEGDFTSVVDMDLSDVVRLIRGDKGSTVRLKVLRPLKNGGNKSLVVSIVRDKIDIKESAAKIKYQDLIRDGQKLKMGVITLPSFYSGGQEGGTNSSYEDVKNLLAEAKKKNVDGVLLDLSRNGGGSLTDAIRISGLFIKQGGIVATKNSGGNVEVLKDEDPETQYTGPMTVLTSRLSASASEILAGALKDYNRAVIVGADHTFGKGTVQQVRPLPPGLGAFKYTMGMFYLPGGDSTQHQGVDSHILFPSVLNTDEIGEKKLDGSLPPSKITSFTSDKAKDPKKPWTPVSEKIVMALKKKSENRIAKSEEFKEIRKEIKESKKDDGVIKLAEVRKKATDNKKDEKEELTYEQRVEEADKPYVDEALNVLADLIKLQNQKSQASL